MGRPYKILMLCSATCNILYGITQFISKPTVLIHGVSYMAYSDGFIRKLKPWAFLSLCLFIGMYGMNTALLAVHFIYRYLVLCRGNRLNCLTSTAAAALWATAVLMWGVAYFLITFYCFCATDAFYEYAEEAVFDEIGKNIRKLSFFCVFSYQSNGSTTIIYWPATIGISVIIAMMVFTFGIMVYCGIAVVICIQKCSMSAKTRSLQSQLVRALIVQGTAPFLIAYLPRLLMFYYVLMGYPPQRFYTYVPMLVTMYSYIDPIANIVLIRDYRSAAFRTLTLCCESRLRKIAPSLFKGSSQLRIAEFASHPGQKY
ncbi:hypothetical protein Q1695_007439 [Nippostrongylus brasiliensis]|nr:hypothetical protein Q1695_007439 [Nippostrongylus brasiliensis]